MAHGPLVKLMYSKYIKVLKSATLLTYAFKFFTLFFSGVPVQQFVGLRPKMYSLLLQNGDEKKNDKGVSKSVIKNDLKHSMYKDCLFNRSNCNHDMTLIRSDNHNLYCDKVNKTSLSCFDDKGYVKSCGVETLAYRHYDIETVQDLQDLFMCFTCVRIIYTVYNIYTHEDEHLHDQWEDDESDWGGGMRIL